MNYTRIAVFTSSFLIVIALLYAAVSYFNPVEELTAADRARARENASLLQSLKRTDLIVDSYNQIFLVTKDAGQKNVWLRFWSHPYLQPIDEWSKNEKLIKITEKDSEYVRALQQWALTGEYSPQ